MTLKTAACSTFLEKTPDLVQSDVNYCPLTKEKHIFLLNGRLKNGKYKIYVAKAACPEKFVFILLHSHDAEPHLSAVSFGNKLLSGERKPAPFLRV